MKIFGLGLNKTGTTSLSNALEILGFRTIHNAPRMLRFDGKEITIDTDYADCFDAFLDLPTPMFYQELDEAYPKSKFILTERNVESWAVSAELHFTKERTFFRGIYKRRAAREYIKSVFGGEIFDRTTWIQVFLSHEKKVKEYFRGREDDFLVLKVCEGDGWEKLCRFLEATDPNVPFPHKNKRGCMKHIRSKFLEWKTET